MEQIELNRTLYDACIADAVDYEYIKRLLCEGANPLGAIDYSDSPRMAYNELYRFHTNNDMTIEQVTECGLSKYRERVLRECRLDGTLPRLTSLFLEHGMDIEKPERPYDFGNFQNPMRMFSTGYQNDVLDTFKLFLDSGIDTETAISCWDLALSHFLSFDYGGEIGNVNTLYCFHGVLYKMLITASYPDLLFADKELQRRIWLEENDFDPINFRDHRRYFFILDYRECERDRQIRRAIISVCEKETKKAVWKFAYGVAPGKMKLERTPERKYTNEWWRSDRRNRYTDDD